MRTFDALKTLLALAVVSAAAPGFTACSPFGAGPRSASNGDSNVGNVGLALDLAPGVMVSSAGYNITGPSGFTKSGSINVANSATLSTVIGGLPAGPGFSIAITATASDGSTSCAGSSTFSVIAHTTTAVTVHLTCHEGSRTGSVLVNGTLNVCPIVDGVSANPAEAIVGSPVALSVSAHDTDNGPSALSFHWTANAGSLSDPAVVSPSFTCSTPGPVTITVTATDGDPAAGCADSSSVQITCSRPTVGVAGHNRVIIFVWDGLRPDSVTPQTTPNLARLRDQQGVNFTDNHSVFPTFTMMNASAFATGSYPATHGFYGNTEYQPGPAGSSAAGAPNNFSQPIFTEDYGVLQALDAFYVSHGGDGLFLVNTLFQAAHAAGLKTAAVGKSGAAFIQDYREDGSGGVILDENIAFPRSFALAVQAAGFPLPANTIHYPYPDGTVALAAGNGDPTATVNAQIVRLNDGATSDPRSPLGSPNNAKNEYMMGIYLAYILPQVTPDLSLIWFRNPDSTEHTFGPGTPAYLDSLKDQDALLGMLQSRVAALGLTASTDIIVVSDHGHSTVAGDPAFFPLRALTGAPDGTGAVGAIDAHGYSVSGDVRLADLLTRAGFAHVFDGNGCALDPVLAGIKADGTPLYPAQVDTTGTICGAAGAKYSTPAFRVPATVPTDAVIIAANGGSDYLYVPSHDAGLVGQLVTALQRRKGYGAIFVRSSYGPVAGTLPLTAINVEGTARSSPPTPDIVVSFDYDESAVTAGSPGLPGTTYESAQNNRGMHGSFSPRDVHNTLIAGGPDFKVAFSDPYPSANVDVAPTVARIFGLALPQANGRALTEAFAGQTVTNSVTAATVDSGVASIGGACNPDDPPCSSPAAATSYQFTLFTKTLTLGDGSASYIYFDKAKATRQ